MPTSGQFDTCHPWSSRPQGIFVGPKGPPKKKSSPSLFIAWINCVLDYVHCSFGSMQANISPTTSLRTHDEQTLYSKALQSVLVWETIASFTLFWSCKQVNIYFKQK